MLDLMSISTSWGLLALWPALAATALYVTTNERVRWVVRCQYHYPHLIGYATVAACVLVLFAFAATLTFATEAAGNRAFHPLKRFAWVLAIVLAPPITLPLYWVRHIRGRS